MRITEALGPLSRTPYNPAMGTRGEALPILPMKDRKAFYTPAEVAALARVDRKTVLNWIHQGKLNGIQLSPRIYRIPLAAVIKLLYPHMIKRPKVRRTGPIPKPGAGERWVKEYRRRVKASA